ncbi:MAG: PQQ-binding-like beta-propeller repeat protein [Kiritimatiellales bacterium]|nr:PQQ-binding-like beta-propeller repeat protein [Kiritimatiellales bacterium]
MKNIKNLKWRPVLLLAVAGLMSVSARAADPYPLGTQLRVLAADVESADYQAMVGAMLTTDLEQEWKRAATPDNYITFLGKHGGLKSVAADPALKAAYERRKQIADAFVDLMFDAYKKKRRKPVFTVQELEQLMARTAVRQTPKAALERIDIVPVMVAPGAEKQWPGYRGPTGQGIVMDTEFPLKWSPTENIRWKTVLPNRGHSSPVIWDDRIFLTAASTDGKLRELLCYARSTGKLLWRQAAPVPEKMEKIQKKNSYASSTSVTDGERVVAFFGNAGFICCDMEGNLLWETDEDIPAFTITHGPATCPVIYKDKVILIQDQNKGESLFIAYDKRTGRKCWQHERPSALGWSNPVFVRYNGHDEMLYNGCFNVKGYHPETGEELWTLAGPTKEAVPMIVTGGGLIYSASGRNGTVLALRPGGKGDITSTHLYWLNERGGPHVPSPVYYQDRLYMVSDMGVMACLDATTGGVVWQERLKGRFTISPLLAGDKLILTSEAGHTYILQAGDQLKILAENDMDEETLATPVILGGNLFIRTASTLYCVGK